MVDIWNFFHFDVLCTVNFWSYFFLFQFFGLLYDLAVFFGFWEALLYFGVKLSVTVLFLVAHLVKLVI